MDAMKKTGDISVVDDDTDAGDDENQIENNELDDRETVVGFFIFVNHHQGERDREKETERW